jgi:hypothetical protein
MFRKHGGGQYFANKSALFHGGLAIEKMYDRVVSDGTQGSKNVLAREALRLFMTGFHDLGMKVGSSAA